MKIIQGKGPSKVDQIVDKAQLVVYQLSTVFPFYLFPVTITIDKEKVSIIYKTFFFSEQVFQVFHKDIKTVELDTDLIFGKMQINALPSVSFLWKNQATKARRIIEGLVVMANEGVDVSQFTTSKELRLKAEEIGKAREGKLPKDVI